VQANDLLYKQLHERRHVSMVAIDFQGDSIDEPTLSTQPPTSSVEISANRGKYTDRELDKLFDLQGGRDRPEEALWTLLRQFEMRMLTEAYNRAAALVAADHRDALKHQKAGA